MTINHSHFGDIFSEILDKLNGNETQAQTVTLGSLSRATSIPKQTLVSWKSGYVKRPRSEIDILIVVAALRCDLEQSNRLLISAGFEELSEARIGAFIDKIQKKAVSIGSGHTKQIEQSKVDLLKRLFEVVSISPTPIKHHISRTDNDPTGVKYLHNLPTRPYRNLIGRETWMNEILKALADKEGRRIIAIDGQGGIGKTSVAYEATTLAHQAGLFDEFVWISAPKQEFLQADSPEDRLTFSSVLNDIASQLQIANSEILTIPQRAKQLREVL